MAITWEAIFEQWPWFAAAAGVLVVVIGLLIQLRPKSKRQPNTASQAAIDSKEWGLTGQSTLSIRVQPESLCFRSKKRGL